MSEALSYRTFLEHESSRMIFEGALNTDIIKILSKSNEDTDWELNWEKAAVNEKEEALTAERNKYKASAYEKYFRTANYYRLAQNHIYEESDNKRRLLQLSIQTYHKAIEFSNHKIEKISFIFNNYTINGYLHIPNCNGPVPCVICIPGLGNNKESMHKWSEQAVKSGMAVLCADGPGYGETRVFQNVGLNLDEFNNYISCAVDYLYFQKHVEISSIGMLGDCFGGYLAFRASKFDKRIKACVLIEAILAFGDEQLEGKGIPKLVSYHLEESQLKYLSEIEEDYYRNLEEFSTPVLIMHAKTDKLIPSDLSIKLYEALSNKELCIYPEEKCYNNYLTNHYNTILDELFRCVPDACDWLSSKL